MTQAITEEMEKEGVKHEWLSFAQVPPEVVRDHFPNIYQRCLEEGYDILREPIPIVPAQHYFMGGIHVDSHSATDMKHLYAVGRLAATAFTGKTGWPATAFWRAWCLPEGRLCAFRKMKRRGNHMNPITMQLVADKYIRLAGGGHQQRGRVHQRGDAKISEGEVQLICKEDGILAGLPVFARVFALLDGDTQVEAYAEDGDAVQAGQLLAKITGDVRVLLFGERTALNYLQRMSGIATYTHTVAKMLEGTKIRLLDTRKTTPCMRVFEIRGAGGRRRESPLQPVRRRAVKG